MRSGLLIALLFAAVTMPAQARDHDAKFLIKHKGKVIGHHLVHVSEDAGNTVVVTDIKMRVKLGPIPLFRYDHDATEIWRDGALVSLESATNHDGHKTAVNAQRREGVLLIDGTDYQGPAPQDALPSSYWDRTILETNSIINTQNGEIIDVTVEALGASPAPDYRTADHYRITGTVSLDIWYDGERWVGSHFIVDGEELTYVLVEDDRQYASLD